MLPVGRAPVKVNSREISRSARTLAGASLLCPLTNNGWRSAAGCNAISCSPCGSLSRSVAVFGSLVFGVAVVAQFGWRKSRLVLRRSRGESTPRLVQSRPVGTCMCVALVLWGDNVAGTYIQRRGTLEERDLVDKQQQRGQSSSGRSFG